MTHTDAHNARVMLMELEVIFAKYSKTRHPEEELAIAQSLMTLTHLVEAEEEKNL